METADASHADADAELEQAKSDIADLKAGQLKLTEQLEDTNAKLDKVSV